MVLMGNFDDFQGSNLITKLTKYFSIMFWLVVTGCHFWIIFPEILGIIIIPIDELIFFRGVAQPPNQIFLDWSVPFNKAKLRLFRSEVVAERSAVFSAYWRYSIFLNTCNLPLSPWLKVFSSFHRVEYLRGAVFEDRLHIQRMQKSWAKHQRTFFQTWSKTCLLKHWRVCKDRTFSGRGGNHCFSFQAFSTQLPKHLKSTSSGVGVGVSTR